MFRIIDNNTGKPVNLEKLVEEDWVKDNIVYCDIEGFAITDEDKLILCDECGNFVFCPTDRFTVVDTE